MSAQIRAIFVIQSLKEYFNYFIMSTKTYGEKIFELKLLNELLDLMFRNKTSKQFKDGRIEHEDVFHSMKRGKLKERFDNVYHFAGSLGARKKDGLIYLLEGYEVILRDKRGRQRERYFFKKVTGRTRLQVKANTTPEGIKFFKGDRIYKALDGQLLRSSQELTIYNLLINESNINVEYEPKYIGEDSTMYPDFKITFEDKKGRSKTILWEHFGMTNNINYDQTVMSRIEKYIQLGFSFEKNENMIFMSYFKSNNELIQTTKNYIKEIKEMMQ